MKRIWLIIVMLVILFIAGSNNVAAQNKFGYFDIDYVVSLMPGISRVDTLLTAYERDSLGQQYQESLKEFNRYDSLMRVRECTFGMGRKLDERAKAAYFENIHRLQNWMEYSQREMKAKHQELTKPFYDKAMDAFQVVISEEKYTYLFKRNIFCQALSADNLAIPVLKKLGLKVPDELLQQDKPSKSALPVCCTQ